MNDAAEPYRDTNRIAARLRDERGAALIVVVMAVIVAVAAVLILVLPGYLGHVKDAEIDLDRHSVATATDVTKITYLQDGASGTVVYYYDELSHKVMDRSRIASIQGYGRSSREQNMREETGARGIPRLPDEDGGPQLLTLTMMGDTLINIRWTGHEWSYWDYFYMKREERNLLTPKDYEEMNQTSEAQARRRARARYEEDFKKLIRDKEDPGIAVYDYDLVNDVIYYDACMTDPDQAVEDPAETGSEPDESIDGGHETEARNTDTADTTDLSAAGTDQGGADDKSAADPSEKTGASHQKAVIPEKAQTSQADQIKAYSLGDVSGSIVQVTIHDSAISSRWVEGSHDAA